MLKGNETRIGKILSIEWLGQTLASLCWIISVFVYEIEGPGDWLQLGAASFSNIDKGSLLSPKQSPLH